MAPRRKTLAVHKRAITWVSATSVSTQESVCVRHPAVRPWKSRCSRLCWTAVAPFLQVILYSVLLPRKPFGPSVEELQSVHLLLNWNCQPCCIMDASLTSTISQVYDRLTIKAEKNRKASPTCFSTKHVRTAYRLYWRAYIRWGSTCGALSAERL